MLEVDSVTWYIEAALNYTYCEPAISSIISTDSVFVNVPVSESGKINFSDVVTAYNEFSSGMNNIFEQTPGDNKKIQLADISIVENNKKATGETYKAIIIIVWWPQPIPFNDTDYWYPIWGAGKCGDYEGQLIGRDGGKLIAEHAAQTIPSIEPGYITDVNILGFCDCDYPEYLWSDILYNPKQACLSPNEMQYWTDQLVALGINNTPSGKRVIAYQVDGTIVPSGQAPHLYSHYAEISYGIWHFDNLQ